MQRAHAYFVYLLASGKYGTLTIGVTNDLFRRILEHREGRGGMFTKKYAVAQLMWFEQHEDVNAAIQREKSLKRWPREWKTNLIEHDNPHWQDLFPALFREAFPPSTFAASGEMGRGHKAHDDN